MTAIGLPIDCFPRRGKRVAPFRDSSKRPAGRSADIQIVVRLANCSQRRLEMTTPPVDTAVGRHLALRGPGWQDQDSKQGAE